MRFNPQLWFGQRELDYIPPHFIKATSLLTPESKLWVVSRLSGRYAISKTNTYNGSFFMSDPLDSIFFEEHSDAVMYELRWSGQN